MSTDFFASCGWDPTEVHARLYGRRPRPIFVSAEERARIAREAAEKERAEREAAALRPAQDERVEPPPEVKAEAQPPRNGEGDRTECGGGDSPPDAAPDDQGREASPKGHAGEVAPEGESPPSAAAPPPPPRAGEEPTRLSASPEVLDWLTGNWEVIEALAAAGKLPDLAPRKADPSPPPAPPPPIHVARGDRWNKHKMACFLRQLAATHNVAAAAKSVGMSRESAHRLRNRLKGQPFDVAWEAASRHGYDALVDAALNRAINGVEVPHYSNGEVVGTHVKYNDHLTLGLLKMRNERGAPMVGRYGAAAEWMSERWDAALHRVETGSTDWSDEHRALDDDARAELDLPDAKDEIDALIERNLPGQGHKPPMRK